MSAPRRRDTSPDPNRGLPLQCHRGHVGKMVTRRDPPSEDHTNGQKHIVCTELVPESKHPNDSGRQIECGAEWLAADSRWTI